MLEYPQGEATREVVPWAPHAVQPLGIYRKSPPMNQDPVNILGPCPLLKVLRGRRAAQIRQTGTWGLYMEATNRVARICPLGPGCWLASPGLPSCSEKQFWIPPSGVILWAPYVANNLEVIVYTTGFQVSLRLSKASPPFISMSVSPTGLQTPWGVEQFSLPSSFLSLLLSV